MTLSGQPSGSTLDAAFEPERGDSVSDSRLPILFWVILNYGAAMTMQLIAGEHHWIPLLFFTGFMVLHGALYWHSPTLVIRWSWMYFLVQGLLIYSAAYLVRAGIPAVLIGLYPVLIGQSVGVFYHKAQVAVVSFGCYALFCLALSVTGWADRLPLLVSLFVMMNVIVVSYSVLFFRQVNAKLRTQSFLRELEKTHRQVEELTLANERQRMARDLHDTLAQGLAGLLLQLEAVDAHLDQDNVRRAQDIVGTAMQRARQTLSDARLVIDDLRSSGGTAVDFIEQVRETVEKRTADSGVAVSLDLPQSLAISGYLIEHCIHVIGEGLANAVQHAEASRIRLAIRACEHSGMLRIQIEDNGKGFNTDTIGKQAGHYGLTGIRERVRLMNGTVDVRSEPGAGTTVEMEVPYRRGERG